MHSGRVGREGTTTATREPRHRAPGSSYLVLLFVVDLGEAIIQPHGEFLEVREGIGIGGVVVEAYGVLQYVSHQEKCLPNVTHSVFLEKENLELMV